jgi:hypothetical protein
MEPEVISWRSSHLLVERAADHPVPASTLARGLAAIRRLRQYSPIGAKMALH